MVGPGLGLYFCLGLLAVVEEASSCILMEWDMEEYVIQYQFKNHIYQCDKEIGKKVFDR